MSKLQKLKISNSVRIILYLAIFSLLLLFTPSFAQTTGTLPKSDDTGSFGTPNDVLISNDATLILEADSPKTGFYLRKIDLTSSGTSSSIKGFFLSSVSSSTAIVDISLSQSNKKASVFREATTQGDNTLVYIVDLSTHTVKALTSASITSNEIGAPAFVDSEGNTLIAGTLDIEVPELITIDTAADKISKRVLLPDAVQSIHVSPNLKQAVITFGGILTQSFAIHDVSSGSIKQLNLDESNSFSVEDFSNKVDFDLFGKKAVISSTGGNHVLHVVDLENNKLITKILDSRSQGSSLSTISSDGRTALVVGSDSKGFTVYKISLAQDGSVSSTTSVSFSDSSVPFDLDISPDQNKAYLLISKDRTKQFLTLSLKDLSTESTVRLSTDTTQSPLETSPNGLFAITKNPNESSVSQITSLNPAPILKSIAPNIAGTNGGTSFTVTGYVNLNSLSSKDLKVCFRSTDICATSVSISKDGTKITGLTPKFPTTGVEDILLTTKDSSGQSVTSTYKSIFEFTKDTTIADSFPPDITISAPADLSFLNTKRVLVLGKVDGTGSGVSLVTVNGKDASFSSDTSSNVINFTADLQFDNDGAFDITVIAKDKSGNESQKIIKINIDTVVPSVTPTIEASNINEFKVSGTTNGTGSLISSITVNSQKVQFTQSESVTFSATTNTLPITITVTDKAGNKTEVKISSAISTDKIPPVITVQSPQNAQIIKGNEKNLNILFTVTDDTSLKEVLLNDTTVQPKNGTNYQEIFTLRPGENLVTILATDNDGNISKTSIRITYIPSDLKGGTENIKEEFEVKEVINLPSEIEDLNSELIDQFTNLTSEGEFLDLASALSVEISNPPPIPEGEPAKVEVPEVEGLETQDLEETPEIPQGFSFATNIDFISDDTTIISEEEQSSQNVVVLVDSAGRTFVVGFAFFEKPHSSNNPTRKNIRFQTIDGEPLKLTSTVTVPGDASLGEATVSILSKNDSLATIPLVISPEKEVKVGKRTIAKPQIKEPLKAILRKSTSELVLKINGKNFLGRIALIDGKLEKLTAKAKFFTNVTFVPNEGIKIKKFKVLKNRIILTAEIKNDITPGIKLLNVITPKGADIAAIVFPDPLLDGNLETTTTPEELILENN